VLSAKTELERTLRSVSPQAAARASARIPFGKQQDKGAMQAQAPKPAAKAAARTGPKPLKKALDQTQSIQVAPKAPSAKPVKEASVV
jgi:hypothetical protein